MTLRWLGRLIPFGLWLVLAGLPSAVLLPAPWSLGGVCLMCGGLFYWLAEHIEDCAAKEEALQVDPDRFRGK